MSMFRLTPFKIVSIYAALSEVWITSFDMLVELLARDTKKMPIAIRNSMMEMQKRMVPLTQKLPTMQQESIAEIKPQGRK
jgi:hypothetical protein